MEAALTDALNWLETGGGDVVRFFNLFFWEVNNLFFREANKT